MNNKSKTTKRNLVSSIISLILCVSMFIGTTFAWFTDSVTSGTNRIVAGNLDIEVSYKNGNNWTSIEGVDSLFDRNALWEPGHTEYVTLKVENKGTLALKYTMKVSPVSESGGINVYDESFKLSDYLYFGTTIPSETEPSYTRDTAREAATSQKLNQADLTKVKDKLMPNKVEYITLVIYMPEDVDNHANYKTGTNPPKIDLGITVLATQVENESDSFGDDYDKDAVNDATVSYNYYPQVRQSAVLTKGSDGTADVDAQDDQVVKTTDGNIIITSAAKVENESAAKATISADAIQFNDATNTATVTLSAEKVNGNFTAVDTSDGNREQTTYDVKVVVEGGSFVNGQLIKVEMFVGKGKSNMVLYHENSEMTNDGTTLSKSADHYIYDKNTGYVEMYVNHFSEFTSVYDAPVASIGTTAYYSLDEAINNCSEADSSITLLNDIALSSYARIPQGKSVILNLNGKVLSSESYVIANFGKLTIKDDSAKGKIVSKTNCAISAGNDSITTITSGNIESVEGAIITGKNNGATINVQGGTLSAFDNAVLAGNGSDRTGNPNTFNISGGTLNGQIKTSGYVACGIYCPWNDNVNFSGGTINVTNGAGIVARAGKVNISGGTINTTGDSTGKVGDSRVVVPCSAIVFDSAANYPAMTDDSKIEVSGGYLKSEDNAVTTVPKESETIRRVEITGGIFSSNPSNYLANGYRVIQNSDGYYVEEEHSSEFRTIDELNTIISGAAEDTISVKLMEDIEYFMNGNAIDNYSYGMVIDGKTVNLDLNGHNIIIHASTNYFGGLIKVSNSTLNILNSGTESSIQTGGHVFGVENNAIIDMTGNIKFGWTDTYVNQYIFYTDDATNWTISCDNSFLNCGLQLFSSSKQPENPEADRLIFKNEVSNQ